MNRVVWKYDIPETYQDNCFRGDSLPHAPLGVGFYLNMPKGAELLTVAMQATGPKIWALVDPSPEIDFERRFFQVVGTGHEEVPHEGVKYIGTWYQDGLGLMQFVFHVFEIDKTFVRF